jgi:hypothetical protein
MDDSRDPPRRPARRIDLKPVEGKPAIRSGVVEYPTPLGSHVRVTDFGKVVEVIPVIERPRVVRQRVLECPCCARLIAMREYEDGTTTIQPYALPLGDPDDIPF